MNGWIRSTRQYIAYYFFSLCGIILLLSITKQILDNNWSNYIFFKIGGLSFTLYILVNVRRFSSVYINFHKINKKFPKTDRPSLISNILFLVAVTFYILGLIS